MELALTCIHNWPKLAWLATSRVGRPVQVLHGPAVEARPDWCAEAVWDGDFAAGDFDRTDRVFGTGLRVRGSDVVFVNAATAMDRLWFQQSEDGLCVSNSLPALCASTGVSLIEGRDYSADIRTTWGAPSCMRRVPVDRGELGVAWYNNLVYDGTHLREQPKIDTAPAFTCYRDYYEFLVDSVRRLGENIRSCHRGRSVVPLATVSSGYDSPAVALLAKHAGCQQAVTIEDATSLWRRSDSGARLAEHIGLACRCYRRKSPEYPNEVAVWAGSGRSGLLSWSLFDYPEPVSALFLGCYGDAAWSRKKIPDPYTENILIDLGMGEFRLHAGMIQCPLAFLGMRHIREINQITLSAEMAPWTLGNDYDRPIPRRMLEEAGIPRGSFAVRKKDTSRESTFRWPYSPRAQQSLRAFLQQRKHFAPSPRLVRLIRATAQLDSLVYKNTIKRLGIRRGPRPWNAIAGTRLLLHWANDQMRQIYARALETLPATESAPAEAQRDE